jgi:probable F420-dependent oxidoreductase
VIEEDAAMSLRIGLGLGDFPFSDGKAFWRWVRLCEEGGVDSLWQSDRLVGSAPFPDCMSVMAALAGATEKMKFGMNVLSLGFRDPLQVAKACASIDFLSSGRLLPAFGLGSMTSPDWQAMDLATQGQGARMDQALDIIARLWRGEAVDGEGPHFAYQGASIRPLPVQDPMPLWLGGSSPAAIRRTARFGSGWQAGVESPAEVAPVVAAIKAAAVEAGRQMDPDHFGAGFSFRFGGADHPVIDNRRAAYRRAFPDRNPDDAMVVGGAAEILRRVKDYAAAGVSKFILRPLGQGDDDIAEQTRLLIAEVLPIAHDKASALS